MNKEKGNDRMPLISIIVPVFNGEEYIERCIESLLSQTIHNIEIIIIDDGSVDNSLIKCRMYEKYNNVHVFHQNNSGAAAARNLGISKATGKYIGFVDSDDYIEPQMYEKMYKVIEKHNVDIVFCNYYTVDSDNKTTIQPPYLPNNRCILKDELIKLVSSPGNEFISWFSWKCLFRTDIIIKRSILFPSGILGEDSIFNLEYFFNCNSAWYINEPLYYYVDNCNSQMRLKHKSNFIDKLNGNYLYRLEICSKYNLNNYKKVLCSYVMTHHLIMLLGNELHYHRSLKEKILVYKEMRNCKMISDAFSTVSIRIINSRVKFLAFLLKYRLYFILSLITN